jgi:hypothetical protein
MQLRRVGSSPLGPSHGSVPARSFPRAVHLKVVSIYKLQWINTWNTARSKWIFWWAKEFSPNLSRATTEDETTNMSTISTSSCINLEDVHPHVEDHTARNHSELLWCVEMMLRIPMNYDGYWRWCWHPEDVDLNSCILMLRMIMLMLKMCILYIPIKEGPGFTKSYQTMSQQWSIKLHHTVYL